MAWFIKKHLGDQSRHEAPDPSGFKEGEEASFEALRLSALQLFDLSDEGQSLQSQEAFAAGYAGWEGWESFGRV